METCSQDKLRMLVNFGGQVYNAFITLVSFLMISFSLYFISFFRVALSSLLHFYLSSPTQALQKQTISKEN